MKKSFIQLSVIQIAIVMQIAVIILPSFSFAQYAKLHDFSDAYLGINPKGNLVSDGTFLYGMTFYGGKKKCGVIFKIMPDGSGYSKLLDFDSTGRSSGSYPTGSLITIGNFIYGMTGHGGSCNRGIIFKIKNDGTGYSKIYDFSGKENGSSPMGSLIWDGTFLYGMTEYGGLYNCGIIFKIKPDGTGYAKLLDFTGTENGSNPKGDLLFDGTFLYGMTAMGGTNNLGVIFKIMPNGTGYSKLLTFSKSPNGNTPFGSLISDGKFLYGMTSFGGTENNGTIFKIKPDGSGYLKLLDFAGYRNGGLPFGSLVSDGTSLYGMAGQGNRDMGIIFKIQPDGTGFSSLFVFSGAADGKGPRGSLFLQEKFLYGMTASGGAGNMGAVFKYGILGIVDENNEGDVFNIIPNSTKGMYIIETKENDCTLTITDVLGKNIYQPRIIPIVGGTKNEIDISKQPKGTYLLNFKAKNGTYSQMRIIYK